MNEYLLSLDLSIEEPKWQQLEQLNSQIQDLCIKILKESGYPINNQESEIFIRLTNDSEIQKINKEYRNKNKPTNVLSFPSENLEPGKYDMQNMPYTMLGDIIIAFETVEKEANSANISVKNHLYHMITHGLLHLLGHDHGNDKEAKEMESLEIKVLDKYGIRNPYL